MPRAAVGMTGFHPLQTLRIGDRETRADRQRPELVNRACGGGIGLTLRFFGLGLGLVHDPSLRGWTD
jgi:hypothetical protein